MPRPVAVEQKESLRKERRTKGQPFVGEKIRSRSTRCKLTSLMDVADLTRAGKSFTAVLEGSKNGVDWFLMAGFTWVSDPENTDIPEIEIESDVLRNLEVRSRIVVDDDLDLGMTITA